MLWSDERLYIGAELEETHIWGTITERDAVIFQDNDFEVFLDPDGDHHMYAEIEVNALNTVWDLLLVRPYRDGGPAITGWDIKGLQTAVHYRGSLNDPDGDDEAWTVEIALPFASMAEIARCQCPPRVGDLWRINFSRVQWQHDIVESHYRKRPGLPEDNWVWSPQGVVDMHRPEHWGALVFAEANDPGTQLEPERALLTELYHAQRAYRAEHGRFAALLPGFGDVTMEATTCTFVARLGGFQIDHESRVTKIEAETASLS
jgi:hypothetical protein